MGTSGPDRIVGTPGPDVIAALGGTDVVRSRGGDDLVCGGAGDDVLDGQGGADTVEGGPGRDSLVSFKGADVLRGGAGGDRIEGLSSMASRVVGGRGGDFLFLAVTDRPGYVLDGGPGQDIGDLRLALAATFGGPALVIRRGPGTLARDGVLTGGFRGIEVLGLDERLAYEYYGTDAPDVVTVSDGAFAFRAETYGGDDEVESYAGDDHLDLGAGEDIVRAGPGRDTCIDAEKRRGCDVVSLSP